MLSKPVKGFMRQLEQFERLHHNGKSTKEHIKFNSWHNQKDDSKDEMYQEIAEKRNNLNNPAKSIAIPTTDESTSDDSCNCIIL